jgi:hypothetical protein
MVQIPLTSPQVGNYNVDAYLHGTSARLMFHVFLGSNLGLGLLLEIKLHRLYFLVTSSGFVGRIFQRADLGLCVPRQLHLLDLKEFPVISGFVQPSGLLLRSVPSDHLALYPNDNMGQTAHSVQQLATG